MNKDSKVNAIKSATTRPKHSASQRMTANIPIVNRSNTIGETSGYIINNISALKTIDYIYVEDDDRKLTGVFSIKELYKSPQDLKVASISQKKPLVTVGPDTDQEEVAYLVLRHGIKAVPVVDKEGALIGAVPHDEVTSILYEELREDILRLAGMHGDHTAYDNVLTAPLYKSVAHRTPWLILGLFGGIAAAQIIGFYENTLQKNIILAAFIPLIVYIADAVGTQLEAFTIRDFALFRKLNFGNYLLKQFSVVLILALILGSAITVILLAMYHKAIIAMVIGLAIFSATLSSTFSGIFVPYIFRKLNFDPANASGPVGTIIQDLLSVYIYFIIASALLK